MSRSIGKWRVALCLQPMYRTDNRQQTHAHNTFRCEWHTTTIVEGELVTHEGVGNAIAKRYAVNSVSVSAHIVRMWS